MDRPSAQSRDSEAPAGQDYEFYPLPGKNPIRLLYLEPDPKTQTLHYTLKAADLSSNPPPVYNCLSYTWAYPQWDKLSADPIDTKHAGDRRQELKCDGQTLKITDNLKDALAQLWYDMASIDEHSQQRIPMWIDSICIHQESNDERSSQVAKMDEIYRHAQKVVVWLGPEDESYTEPAVDVLARLSAVPKENRNADIPSGLNHREIYKNLGIKPVRDFEWLALGELLMRTWFGRMWVIQELFEAREVLVYCGTYVLEWQQIVDVSELLRVTRLGRSLMEYLDAVTRSPFEEEEYEEEDEDEGENEDEDNGHKDVENGDGGNQEKEFSEDGDLDRAEYVVNTVNNQWLFESLREQKNHLKLETLLTYARYFGATGHSDYVYAVRGMWKPLSQDLQRLRESIKPNYKIPVEDVFTAAAYASAIEMGDLNLLSLVEDRSLREIRARKEGNEGIKAKELPSWVPDWSITPIAETLCMNPRPEKGSERWIASKDLPYASPPEPIERRLHVKGMCITTIFKRAARAPKFLDNMDGVQIFACLELLSTLQDHSSSATASNRIDSFWRTIIKDTYRDEKADDAAKKAFTSFLAVRIFEVEQSLVDANSSQLQSPMPEIPLANDSPLAHIKALITKLSSRDTSNTIPTYETIRRIIKKGKSDVAFAGVNEEEQLFAESFRLAYIGRRLFYTAENGPYGIMLGIGPESLKNGDEVWVIAGADVPMVLRPSGKGGWILVGECYVHGIMGREGIRGVGGESHQETRRNEKLVDVCLI